MHNGIIENSDDIKNFLLQKSHKFSSDTDSEVIAHLLEYFSNKHNKLSKILLNTLGGRMPYGYRIKGRNGEEMKENVMRSVDRTLLRLKTVAERLEKSIIRNA